MSNFGGLLTGQELGDAVKKAGNWLAGVFFFGLLVGGGTGALIVKEILDEEITVAQRLEADARNELAKVSADLMNESTAKLNLAKELKKTEKRASELDNSLRATNAELLKEKTEHEETRRSLQRLSYQTQQLEVELSRYRESEVQTFFANLPLGLACGSTSSRTLAGPLLARSNAPIDHVPRAVNFYFTSYFVASFAVLLVLAGLLAVWRVYINNKPPVIYRGGEASNKRSPSPYAAPGGHGVDAPK